MRQTVSLPPKAERFTCRDCGFTARRPIVVPGANPTDHDHGRCSNRQACPGRMRRAANKAKETGNAR
jgi:hypothetical protein